MRSACTDCPLFSLFILLISRFYNRWHCGFCPSSMGTLLRETLLNRVTRPYDILKTIVDQQLIIFLTTPFTPFQPAIFLNLLSHEHRLACDIVRSRPSRFFLWKFVKDEVYANNSRTINEGWGAAFVVINN